MLKGRTVLKSTEVIKFRENSSGVRCTCGKLFNESLKENGIFFGGIVCARCEKEMALIYDSKEKPLVEKSAK